MFTNKSIWWFLKNDLYEFIKQVLHGVENLSLYLKGEGATNGSIGDVSTFSSCLYGLFFDTLGSR